jgi:hypothetical protein
MPKVSTQVQRRIAELDAKYTIAQPKRPGRRVVVLIILAIIAMAAFASANRTTSDFVELTLKQGPTEPKRQLSDAEASGEMECRVGSSFDWIQKRRVS